MPERVTLITGASSGIGAELARVFAANGHRLVLIARREDRMRTLAEDIARDGGPGAIIIACDLEQPEAGETITAVLAAHDVEVEFIVNNAGYGLFGRAATLKREAQLGMIAVNIRTLTDLTLRFADSVIRHRGGILNVASIAGFLPGPGMAVYYASKAYVLSFTEALRGELRPQGVRVTALCPGPVPSEFQARAGVRPGYDKTLLDVSARDVALAGYRGLMADTRVVLPGLGIRIMPLLLRFLPRGLVLAAIARFNLGPR